ncbi:MAG: hypothetical protein ACFCU8_20360 [Thermosynechococcaceae cyanobacterium]
MNTKIRSLAAKALSGLFLVATIVTVSLATPFHNGVAIAATYQPIAGLFSKAESKAKSDLNNTAGAGSSRQVEGVAQQAKGAAQRQFGNTTTQAKGAANQVGGRAKQDLGRVEGTAEGIGSDIQDAAEGITDKVKGLIN